MTTNSLGQNKKLGIYIHVPFCVKKCAYCDFLSFEGQDVLIHKVYTKALIKEIESHALIYGDKYSVDSVFIGGGTPSVILPSMIDGIIKTVKNVFNTDVNMEITIEANPKTLSEDKLESYLNSGINRISIGAQSFQDYMLRIMGRAHFSEDISKTFKMARDAGFQNINLDLMFAVPGQDMNIWQDTLNKAIGLEPEHISFYSLQIEKGTKFYDMFETGPYEKISDKLDREMYHFAVRQFQDAGYARYEISNVAESGYECRHNIKYWTMEDYLGAGVGAHSYIGGKRFGNIKDIEAYIELNLEGGGAEPEGSQEAVAYKRLRESSHENSMVDDVSEYMFTGLRMIRGISLEDFELRFKKPLREIYAKERPVIEQYLKDGFLILEDGRIRLSEKGVDVSNKIMSVFTL